ncbi:MFS transporter [Novosphingobium album (ex Liu et al. 2023)]|uniref:MFS transporter n=1 Tax=Novosphingobium album (ex Liu et al. 2023) TaxID=3031130 RepID=A0ABT5WXB9_9SPHN|nr:MFS transporter [Novosphingobium album (ex Liu et al. 2023)]MDE8654549.1 MFS transporter [Novosphingobium album (ex Liu et al. 2023)]
MSYLGELRQNIRPLAAASLGSGTSLPLFAYTNSVFAPHLVAQFGWSRSQFALVGLTMLTTLFVLPFIGRFTDRIGVRRIALLGTILVPLCFVGYAVQDGRFGFFLVVSTLTLATGSLTSPLVYTRLIAENFARATGLALTIVNCVPALLAMVLVPLVNWSIEHHGWRTAYLGLAALTLLAGLAAVWLIPRDTGAGHEAAPGANVPDMPAVVELHKPAKEDYRTILTSPVFWVIFIGMFLCLLQTPLHASQMNLMLVDNQVSTQTAANIVTIYAFGTVVGRIACGLALDRFATPIVTTLSMVLPSLGFFLLGTDLNTVGVISFAMFLVGLSIGAESDLISYLVARYFKLRIYNTTLGLVYCVSFLASAIGAVGISRTLAMGDSFSPYLYFVSGTIAIGSLLFLLLPWSRERARIG